MTEHGFPSGALIEMRILPGNKSGIVGILGQRTKYPCVGKANQILIESIDAGGLVSWHDVSTEAGNPVQKDGPTTVYLVNRERWGSLHLFIPGLVSDSNKRGWNMMATVRVRLADGVKLLGKGVAAEIDEHRPITEESLCLWLPERITSHIKDRFWDRSYEQLSSPDVTPLPIWKESLGTALESFGMQVEVATFPNWSSRSDEAVKLEEQKRAAEEKAKDTDRILIRLEEQESLEEVQRQILRAEIRDLQHRESIQDENRKGELEQARTANELKLAELDSERIKRNQVRELLLEKHRLELSELAQRNEDAQRLAELDRLSLEGRIVKQKAVSPIETANAKLEAILKGKEIEAKIQLIERNLAKNWREEDAERLCHQQMMMQMVNVQKPAANEIKPRQDMPLTVLQAQLSSAVIKADAPEQVLSSRSSASVVREISFENSLGMKFVPVQVGLEERRTVYFCIWPTRVKDYAAFALAQGVGDERWREPGFPQGPENPVVYVNWEESRQFCMWLTAKERRETTINNHQEYRLPTDNERSWAVGIGDQEERAGKCRSPRQKDRRIKTDEHPWAYPWGRRWPPPSEYLKNENRSIGLNGSQTFPVGISKSNHTGLYDLCGNVMEWCMDAPGRSQPDRQLRTVRGTSKLISRESEVQYLSSKRGFPRLEERFGYIGFRIVLADTI
jgi:hypothetical protein